MTVLAAILGALCIGLFFELMSMRAVAKRNEQTARAALESGQQLLAANHKLLALVQDQARFIRKWM